MLNEKNLERLEEMAREIIAHETNEKRKAEMLKHFSNRFHDDGFFGRIEELHETKTKSRKIKVGTQGEKDITICIMVNGKKRYVPAEVKTNGGRIGNIRTAFVVYSVCVHNSLSDFEIAPTLWKTSDFLKMLFDCKAIKSTNGKNPELAIQVSSRKMWRALENHLAENGEYTPNRVY